MSDPPNNTLLSITSSENTNPKRLNPKDSNFLDKKKLLDQTKAYLHESLAPHGLDWQESLHTEQTQLKAKITELESSIENFHKKLDHLYNEATDLTDSYEKQSVSIESDLDTKTVFQSILDQRLSEEDLVTTLAFVRKFFSLICESVEKNYFESENFDGNGPKVSIEELGKRQRQKHEKTDRSQMKSASTSIPGTASRNSSNRSSFSVSNIPNESINQSANSCYSSVMTLNDSGLDQDQSQNQEENSFSHASPKPATPTPKTPKRKHKSKSSQKSNQPTSPRYSQNLNLIKIHKLRKISLTLSYSYDKTAQELGFDNSGSNNSHLLELVKFYYNFNGDRLTRNDELKDILDKNEVGKFVQHLHGSVQDTRLLKALVDCINVVKRKIGQ